jgi:hypothetical protein
MVVVNCKVKFIRPKYNDLKLWMEDKNNIYIGRSGIVFILNDKTGIKERFPKKQSLFANPFKINKNKTREQVIELYENYIRNEINKNDELKDELLKLKGKNLGCWCHPEPCHGDVLIKLIDEYNLKN